MSSIHSSYKMDALVDKSLPRPHLHKPVIHVWTPAFPVLCAFFGILSFITGYTIGVLNDHEERWFSYISDGGATVPESCIFGILLNISSFFWFATCFSRHIQLYQYVHFHRGPNTKHRIAAWFLLLFGCFSGLGTMLVANFQEGAVGPIHGLGALFSFIGGMLYVWLYVIISVIMRPTFSPRCLTIFRVIMALIVTASLTVHEVCLMSPTKPFVKAGPDGEKPPRPTFPPTGVFRWKPEDPYYMNHLVAAIAEWVLGVGFFIVVSTFFYELNSFEVNTLTDDQERFLVDEGNKPVLLNAKHFEKEKI